MRNKVDSSIKPYLNELADKLWSQPSRATVMVGAGFSKNASNEFPSWSELGDIFYQKLHGEYPANKVARYTNILKLADSVDAVFGRPALDELLMNNIPNLTVNPSVLHKKLLSLPWTDVFTTNYDTLLERAAESVVERRYDVVTNSGELIHATSPRIIKLHGSFPNAKPYIISEEDYRIYPDVHAPFVNTVQQSLLENTLCLIGFSGDDPNFLKWIGWIRDNLGENKTLKIYLVGVFNFTDADKALLSKRNVTIIDMFKCMDVTITDHYKALEIFIDYLRSKEDCGVDLSWPQDMNLPYLNASEDISKEALEKSNKEVIEKLKMYRKSYPGWLVAPHTVRERLKYEIRFYKRAQLFDNDSPLQDRVDFLFEIVWYTNLLLEPIIDDLALLIENVVESTNKCSTYKYDKKWLELVTSLSRYYREEFEWDKHAELLSCLGNEYSNDNAIIYEQSLSLLIKLEFEELKAKLKSWYPSNQQANWVLKKAALLSEIGEVSEAYRLVQGALSYIRQQLNLSRLRDNIKLLSLESYAIVLLDLINISGSESEDYSKRRNVLSAYQCDPYRELDHFETLLETSELSRSVSIKYEFEIGRTSTTHTYSNDKVINSFTLIRFYEEAGLPVRANNRALYTKPAANALSITSEYYPLFSIMFLLRLRRNDAIDDFLSRKSLIRVTANTAIVACEIMEKQLILCLNEKIGKNNIVDFSSTIIRVFSRLSVVLPYKKNHYLYNLIIGFISEGKISYNDDVRKFFINITHSCPSSKISCIIQSALSIRNLNIFHMSSNPPLGCIDIPDHNDFYINDEDLDYMISLLNSGDEDNINYALFSFFKIIKFSGVKESQLIKISKSVSKLNENEENLKGVRVFRNALVYLMEGEAKNKTLEVLHENILKFDIPIAGDSKGYTVMGSRILPFYELEAYVSYRNLSKDELISLTQKLINWWDVDKDRLKKPTVVFDSNKSEFEQRFSKLLKTFKFIIIPNKCVCDFSPELMSEMERVFHELEVYNLPSLCQRYQFKNVSEINNPNDRNKNFPFLTDANAQEFAEEIKYSLASNDKNRIDDALDTLSFWLSGESCLQEGQLDCLQFLSYKILFLGGESLAKSIFFMHQIIIDFTSDLPNEIVDNFCLSIDKIYKGFHLSSDDSDKDVWNKVLLRHSASKCASVLVDKVSLSNEQVNILSCWKHPSRGTPDFKDITCYWF